MMNVYRTLMLVALPLVAGWAPVQAQESTPKTNARAAPNAAVQAHDAVVKSLEGPFVVKPYLQPGHSVVCGQSGAHVARRRFRLRLVR